MKIIICGSSGKMGCALAKCAEKTEKTEIAAGIDKNIEAKEKFPVFKSVEEVSVKADVLVDFSHPSALPGILEYCVSKKMPAVICTTGLSSEDLKKLKSASEKTAIFYSRNMSVGINLLLDLVRRSAKILGENFNVEIIEKHHNEKIDAPSGTALMIAEEISESSKENLNYVFNRTSKRGARSKNEIGIHCVRAGNICGDHEVIFAGENEIITVSHHAQSRNIFAQGALKAAEFINGKAPGLYTMSDMISA